MGKWAVLTVMFLAACTSQPDRSEIAVETVETAAHPVLVQTVPLPAPAQIGPYRAQSVSGDYAGYPELNRFIDHMVAQHGFDREFLNGLFSEAKRKHWTLNYLRQSDAAAKGVEPYVPSRGSWTRYLAKFLDKRHVNSGTDFWHKHEDALQRAYERYGVPPEYILGILAVETTFGGYVGNHRVLDALTTLAFDYPRRADYFRGELENFLVMAGKEGLDPAKPVGSFAGAMGLGQFMPSSFLHWAVDFNGDGRRNLWNPEDAIGSIANYFVQHGWQPGRPVVTSAHAVKAKPEHIEAGVTARYSLASLNSAGIYPTQNCDCDYPLHLLWLRHNKNDEFRLGHPNFYVITRYNQSTYYAMAVHELALAIKKNYRKRNSPEFFSTKIAKY